MHREQIQNYMKKYYRQNKEKILIRVIKRQKENKAQYAEYHNTYRQNIRKTMKQLKINGCAVCGYDKHTGSLDFHHVNPKDKKFNITNRALQFKDDRIIDELNKCILLCCNCHREIENNRCH